MINIIQQLNIDAVVKIDTEKQAEELDHKYKSNVVMCVCECECDCEYEYEYECFRYG